MTKASPGMHRTIVCVDVEGFGDRRRTHPHQMAVRAGLYRALRTAFGRSGIDWRSCYHEDRGDGALILVPADVSKNRLTSDLPAELAAAVVEHNRSHDRLAQIRLRLAVHAGEIHYDAHGLVGSAINLAFRLLESERLKSALADSSGVLVLIASQWIYEEVIRHDPASAPELFRQFQVAVKETRASAWISRPDDPYRPGEDSEATPPSARDLPVPRQLPVGTAVFIGRTADLSALDALMTGDGARQSMVISAIVGGAGVGKTTLAVQWAHRVRDRFPDGDLFVDLNGYGPFDPLSSMEALGGFLRAFDVPPAKVPADLQQRAALFRSILAGRRVLVVLDNAASAEQVRPLLPSTSGCLVVVTSRSRLSGLTAGEGAKRMHLEVLSPTDSIRLLQQIIGTDRVIAERAQAEELARRCAFLPLALRIAADRAVDNKHLRLADLVEELAAERDRLASLETGDDASMSVRAVFSWSYRRLPASAARAFRLLGMYSGSDIGLTAAAALQGLSTSKTAVILDQLAGQHLIENTGRNRYRFHELLLAYAAERAVQDEPEPVRAAALERLLAWYLSTAAAANHVFFPHGYEVPLDELRIGTPTPIAFTDQEQAAEWFEIERANLVAAVRQAADSGNGAIAWKMAYTLSAFLNSRCYTDDWSAVLLIACPAARATCDERAQALMWLYQGDQLRGLGRYQEAIDCLTEALSFSRAAGDRHIEGFCHSSIGLARTEIGDLDAAVDQLERALAIFREIPDKRGVGIALCNLGVSYLELGRLQRSIDCNRQASEILRETGNINSRAAALRYIGDAHARLRQHFEARRYYQEALDLLQGTRYRRQLGLTLSSLGENYLAVDRPEEGEEYLQKALVTFTGLDRLRAAELRTRLAVLRRDRGDSE